MAFKQQKLPLLQRQLLPGPVTHGRRGVTVQRLPTGYYFSCTKCTLLAIYGIDPIWNDTPNSLIS